MAKPYVPKEGMSIRDSTHLSEDKWRKVYLEKGYFKGARAEELKD